MKKYTLLLWLLLLSMILLSLPVSAGEESGNPAMPSQVAAVISRGFVGLDRACFAEFTGDPQLTGETLKKTAGLTAREGYVSPLFPLVYDYAEQDSDASSSSTTGSALAACLHKAVPSAQLLLMKVYDNRMSYTCEAVVAALNDAHALGASVILLDIAQLPAPKEGQPSLEETLDRLNRAGVLVVCPAGDRGSIGYGSNYSQDEGIHLRLAANPDSNTLSPVGALSSVFSVAAALADHTEDHTLMMNGQNIPYTDTTQTYLLAEGKTFRQVFADRLPQLVPIPGLGKSENFRHLEVKGKIALIQRGEIPFYEKVNNAAQAGAVGVIVYDNEKSDTLVNMDLTDAALPAIFISAAHGELLLTAKEPLTFRQTAATGEVSSISSWGTAPDLSLKPDLIADGEMVLLPSFAPQSAEDVDSYYSGTVFAAAAAAARALELRTENPALTAGELRVLLMNSAIPMVNEEKVPLSPRRQGAGMLTEDAIVCSGLLTAPDGSPALALGDRIGSAFVMKFTLTNPTKTTQTYEIGAELLTDGTERPAADLPLFISHQPRRLNKARIWLGENAGQNLNRFADNYTGLSLTLKPGESRTISAYVRLDNAERKACSTAFPNGYFLEGFLTASAGGSTVTLPFLGFSESFHQLNIFDSDIYSGDSFYYTNWLASYRLEGNTRFEDILGEIATEEGMIYDDSLLSFSPNQDNRGDQLYYSFCLLRGAYRVSYDILDSRGKVIFTDKIADYLPANAAADASPYELALWDGSADDNSLYIYPDGEYTLVIRAASSPAEDAFWESRSYTFRLDTEKPVLEDYQITAEGKRTQLRYVLSDDSGIKSITITNQRGNFHAVSHTGEKALTWTQEALDITYAGQGYLYLEIVDYAGNTAVYRLNIT